MAASTLGFWRELHDEATAAYRLLDQKFVINGLVDLGVRSTLKARPLGAAYSDVDWAQWFEHPSAADASAAALEIRGLQAAVLRWFAVVSPSAFSTVHPALLRILHPITPARTTVVVDCLAALAVPTGLGNPWDLVDDLMGWVLPQAFELAKELKSAGPARVHEYEAVLQAAFAVVDQLVRDGTNGDTHMSKLWAMVEPVLDVDVNSQPCLFLQVCTAGALACRMWPPSPGSSPSLLHVMEVLTAALQPVDWAARSPCDGVAVALASTLEFLLIASFKKVACHDDPVAAAVVQRYVLAAGRAVLSLWTPTAVGAPSEREGCLLCHALVIAQLHTAWGQQMTADLARLAPSAVINAFTAWCVQKCVLCVHGRCTGSMWYSIKMFFLAVVLLLPVATDLSGVTLFPEPAANAVSAIDAGPDDTLMGLIRRITAASASEQRHFVSDEVLSVESVARALYHAVCSTKHQLLRWSTCRLVWCAAVVAP